MRRTILGVAVAGAVAGVAVARRRTRQRDGVSGRSATHDRWHSVTVNCEPERLGPLPPPLDELGFEVEVRVRPAPGARGTELAARVVGDPSTDAVRRLRKGLREARALVEIGEVPLPDAPSTTKDTPLNQPLAHAIRHGREEGRL